MPKFKDLTTEQKRKLLRDEYLSDGAHDDIVDELIPGVGYGYDDYADKIITNRLKEVFGYTNDMEVAL